MYAITGITGQVGGAVARNLLRVKCPVRAVLRDAGKAAPWAARGCDIALAAIDDAAALTAAFRGAEGVFLLLPSSFDPAPGFPEVRRIVTAVRSALEAARPAKLVCLSTIGAQAAQPNLLNQLGIMEQMLGELAHAGRLPAGGLVHGERGLGRDAGARDRRHPELPATPGQAGARWWRRRISAVWRRRCCRRAWSGRRIVELEGPRRVTPNDIARGFSEILGRPVRMEAVPRETWGALFTAQGMKDPIPRIQMLDGFNEGWIEFEGGEAGSIKGETELETVLRGLVDSAP